MFPVKRAKLSLNYYPDSRGSRAKKLFVAILVLISIALIVGGLGYALYGLFQLSRLSTSNIEKPIDLRITSYVRVLSEQSPIENGEDYLCSWTVSVRVSNRGSENVNDAKLVVELTANGKTITSSTSKTYFIQNGWADTIEVTITAKRSQISDDTLVVCTVYAGEQMMDQYTKNWS